MNKRQACAACGKCCISLGFEITMTPGDYRRWKHQGRDDILRYAFIPPGKGGFGYLWFDPIRKLEMDRCPFLMETEPGKYICGIQETKPKVCREFWCAWTYGEGEKALPFKVSAGWTSRAEKSGYGQPRKLRQENP